MKIQLSDHFSYGRLLRFVLPSIVMMIITSIYSVVDGLFVSNYVGTVPFAALNLVYPMLMGLSALGFMMGTGGSALVSKTLGQGDKARANRYFSMIVYATLLTGIVLAFLAFVFMRPLSVLLGELRSQSGTRYAPAVVRLFDDPAFCADFEQELYAMRQSVYLDVYQENM